MEVNLHNVKYRICDHALRQMGRRGISKRDIQSCLDNHQVDFEPKEGYSLYIANHPNGKRLQVISNPKTEEIVSAVWLD